MRRPDDRTPERYRSDERPHPGGVTVASAVGFAALVLLAVSPALAFGAALAALAGVGMVYHLSKR